jgi:hypothetical protein
MKNEPKQESTQAEASTASHSVREEQVHIVNRLCGN